MDEKRPSPFRGRSAVSVRRNRNRPCITMALLALCIFLLYHIRPLYSLPGRDHVKPLVSPTLSRERLVPLEAHIMSKCPDARDCLRDLVLPAMQKVIDKVDFTLSYIGTPTENDGVKCKHGPDECLGNIIELCAAKLYPDPKTYLGFVMCLTKDYKEIPSRSLIEDCALEHAVDFKKVNDCAGQDDGAYGMGLLRSSVRRSADAKVTTSCTVRLDEKVYCVRDSGEWKDCPSGSGVNDLVIAVEKLHKALA